MTTRNSENRLRGSALWVLLLALVSVGVVATAADTSSASIPTNSPGTQEPGVQVPDGGGCWSEISTQNVMTGGNYLDAMDGDSDTGAILAAGHYTTDLGLRDEGGTGGQTQIVQFYTGSSFQMVPNPPGLGEFSRLLGVGAIPGTNNEFWVVGTHYTATNSFNLIERFNGSSLSIVPSPSSGTVGRWLNDVDASSSNFAIAVGRTQSGGQLLPVILRWNGTEWVAETPPNFGNGALSGVTTFPDGRAVAVGIDYDPDVRHVMITRDTGGTWSQVSLLLPGSSSRLTGVDATGPTDIWAVGYRFDVTANGFTPYSVIGNLNTNTWDIVDMPIPSGGDSPALEGNANTYALGISCEPGGSCYAVGYHSPTGGNDGPYEAVMAMWLEVFGIEGAGNARASDLGAIPSEPDGGWVLLDPPPIGTFANSSSAVFAYGPSPDRVSAANNHSDVGGLGEVTVQRYEEPCGGPQPSPTPGGPTPTPIPIPTATPTPIVCTPHVYSDVPTNHTFYQFITCLSQRGVVSGYSDCTFRPNNEVTRGQIAKMVSSAAGFNDDVTGRHTYTDVPSSHTFWVWIERLSLRGVMGGYPCGGQNEPCDPQSRPYFRPQNNATRGQVSKIVSNAANIQDPVTSQFYADVPPTHTFYVEIMRLTGRGVMSGYNCGGTGEPCDPQNRPYFRPGNNVTRGQSSKIVANTFFPNCQIR